MLRILCISFGLFDMVYKLSDWHMVEYKAMLRILSNMNQPSPSTLVL